MPYPPGLSGYLTERGTLFYNGRTSEENLVFRALRYSAEEIARAKATAGP